MNTDAELYFAAHNELGEGPVYEAARDTLWWVDINKGALHALVLGSREHRVLQVNGRLGCAALCDYEMLLGVELDLTWIDTRTGSLRDYLRVHDPTSYRFNDGQVDPAGRFWVGTMSDNDEGHLYRLDGGLQVMKSGVGASNGIGWSPDQKTMYYTDSHTRAIYAYDYDVATGDIANKRLFYRAEQADEGIPDGLCVDAEGCVWSARWDGWRIVRHDPDGVVERLVRVPCQRPTSCAFVGADYDLLVITSAQDRLSEAERRAQPDAGNLFAVRPGPRGMAPNIFRRPARP